jgi:hypothetical protein
MNPLDKIINDLERLIRETTSTAIMYKSDQDRVNYYMAKAHAMQKALNELYKAK